MAFSVEAHTSQARPKSESNSSNATPQEQCNISTPKSNPKSNNHSDRICEENSNQFYTEKNRKSQRYNIDDPGASTSRAAGASGAPNITVPGSDGWRDKLLAQLLLLSEENKANGAYDGFAYVHNNHHNTDCDKQPSQSKNPADQGAHKQQQQKQQESKRDRAQGASNSRYQNTLFTRVGINSSASQPGSAFDELFSKSDRFGDANHYLNLLNDWDCNIPASIPSGSRFTDYGNGEPNGPGFERASDTDPGLHGRSPAGRCGRAAIPPGYEWSNAYCHS